MTTPSDPPTVAAAPPKAESEARGGSRRWPRLSRRVGCLAVWLLFLTPAIYSLLLVYFPLLEIQLSPLEGPPHPLQPWLARGPANSLHEWIANVDPGPTMVYLIFAAVLVLFSVAVFVREEPSSH